MHVQLPDTRTWVFDLLAELRGAEPDGYEAQVAVANNNFQRLTEAICKYYMDTSRILARALLPDHGESYSLGFDPVPVTPRLQSVAPRPPMAPSRPVAAATTGTPPTVTRTARAPVSILTPPPPPRVLPLPSPPMPSSSLSSLSVPIAFRPSAVASGGGGGGGKPDPFQTPPPRTARRRPSPIDDPTPAHQPEEPHVVCYDSDPETPETYEDQGGGDAGYDGDEDDSIDHRQVDDADPGGVTAILTQRSPAITIPGTPSPQPPPLERVSPMAAAAPAAPVGESKWEAVTYDHEEEEEAARGEDEDVSDRESLVKRRRRAQELRRSQSATAGGGSMAGAILGRKRSRSARGLQAGSPLPLSPVPSCSKSLAAAVSVPGAAAATTAVGPRPRAALPSLSSLL